MGNRLSFILCALLAVAGILLLSFSFSPAEPVRITTYDIDKYIGERVELTGELRSVYSKNGNLFLTICAGNCVPAVIFKQTFAKINSHDSNLLLLRRGDRLRITGKVTEYKGKPELVVDGLEVLP